MISKEFFIQTMEQLKSMYDRMCKVGDALRELDRDFNDFYFSEAITLPITILTEIFNDQKSQWLEYFVYELDWLENYRLGYITVNEQPIGINGWGDVYDFLIECMGESK